MNIERLTAIAEWLEAGAPERLGVSAFDMRSFEVLNEECGTVCCIAGAANNWWHPDKNVIRRSDPEFFSLYAPATRAAIVLGIEITDALLLFGVDRDHDFYSRMTPGWAARCVRKLIETGHVDWQGTREATA